MCAAGILMLGLGAVGADPQWRDTGISLCEAIVVRDIAQVVRRVEAGEDPNRSCPVDEGANRGASRLMTPLEAATAAGDPAIVNVLVEHGADR